MIQYSDIKIIIHLLIHNPKELEAGKLFQGNFPKEKSGDILKLVDKEDLLMQQTSDADWLLYFGNTSLHLPGYGKRKFYYINNPDGTIRWIFPQYLKKPLFLNFYARPNMRSKMIALFYTLAFFFKMKRLVSSGCFTVFKKIRLKSTSHFLIDGMNMFALFTGTVGPNRKAVMVARHKNQQKLFYVKIPLTERALNNILHEDEFLSDFEPPENTIVPTTRYWNDPPYIFVTDIKPGHAVQSVNLNKVKIDFLLAMAKKHKRIPVSKSSELNRAKELLKKTDFNRIEGAGQIKDKIQTVLRNTLDGRGFVYESMAHGDFTPWNSYTQKDKLYLFDWEMAKERAPLFFDLFHYVFQKGVMIERKNFKEIKKEIFRTFDLPALSWFVQKRKINPADYFKYYLLINASYYLYIYSLQERLHRQVSWQLEVWSDAFDYFIKMEPENGYKASFIDNLREFIADKPYALLKKIINPEELAFTNNDLDILVTKKLANEIFEYCKKDSGITHVNRIKHAHMHTLDIYFDDLSFLRVDLLFSVRRKSVVFVDAAEALSKSVLMKNGWRYLSDEHELDYIKGFYWLNGQNIPDRYIRYYHLKPADISVQAIAGFKKKIKGLKINMPLVRLLHLAQYILDVLKHISSADGLIITYSGVDGVGKTTVLTHIAKTFKTKYRKEVVMLRHRPSVLPIISAWFYGREKAERMAAMQPPHAGNNTSQLLSLLRFSYYFIDYLFGQFYIYLKYVAKGYLVIYDRYYFDFVSDARRSNLVVNKKLAQFLYVFLIKPDFNFFLYADPDEILKRKRELEKETIVELTKNYRQLFSHYSNRYRRSRYSIIKNSNLSNTLLNIEREFVYHQN